MIQIQMAISVLGLYSIENLSNGIWGGAKVNLLTDRAIPYLSKLANPFGQEL